VPFAVGTKLPELKFTSLSDGRQSVWQPSREGDTLIVFCALWHPDGRRLLRDAVQRAKRDGLHLAAFSIDWMPEQATRQRQAIPDAPEVLYAGSAGLTLGEEWRALGPAKALIVAADGRVLKDASPGRLP
jgi:hypothetical protein